MGVAPNQRARVTQRLVFGSICQGAVLVHVFEPQPCGNFEESERNQRDTGSAFLRATLKGTQIMFF